MNNAQLIEARKVNASAAMVVHDAMPAQWRDLCNEYGERAVALYAAAVPYPFGRVYLEAERQCGLI